MVPVVRFGALVGLLVFCVACDAQRPTAPSPPPSSTPPTAPPSGPPLSGPSTTYHFSAPLDRPVIYATTTKYMLYNNGAFSLRYDDAPGVAYTGSYRQEDGRILFDFGADGRGSVLGGPDATGTLNGALLEVRYSFEFRVGADFEDAVYQRTE